MMNLKRKLSPPFATGEKKGLTIKPFRFLFQNNTTTVPRPFSHYRPPKLKKEPNRWYIEYWYRVPIEVRQASPEIYPKEWHRFRVFEDINRHKSDQYAKELLKAVEEGLASGYNPFDEHKAYFIKKEEEPKISLNQGLDLFVQYCRHKQLRENTVRAYAALCDMLKIYFLKENRIYEPVETFTKNDLKNFFASYRSQWSNSTINNNITYIRAIFNWFVKEDIIMKSPASALEMLPVKVIKHKYYPDDLAEKLKCAISKQDPELFEFMQMVYYCAIRPQELRALQVKHILFDRKLLFVPAGISKNKTDDYIPLGEHVLALLQSRKDLPSEYYLFGGQKPRSVNYFSVHYKPFKEKYGLGEDYSIYSWKHSRAIHLAQAGADPYQIMRLFRHSSLEITMAYLRDLGLTDFSELHAKTKKF
jgi:integrase